MPNLPITPEVVKVSYDVFPPIVQPQPSVTQPVAIPYGLPTIVPIPIPVNSIITTAQSNPVNLTTAQSYSAVPGGSAVIDTALALASQQKALGINPTFTYDQFGNAYDASGNRIDIT